MIKIILILFPLITFAGTTTVKKIDQIENNTGSDIILNPDNKVINNSLTGGFALQSSALKEIEDSSVTIAVLDFIKNLTSDAQDQINSKTPLTRLITTTSPLFIDGLGSADLSLDRTISMTQSATAENGWLSSIDWNIFNNKQDELPLTTQGDILYRNVSGLARLSIGAAGTVLTAHASGQPTWAVVSSSPTTQAGDLIFNFSGTPASDIALHIGTEGQLLTTVSGLPSWQDAPVSTTLDTKGQLQGFSTVNTNVGPCINDEILIYDTAESTGWKCGNPPASSPTTTEGDLIVRGSSIDERLPSTSDVGYVLTNNGVGVKPTYQAPPVAVSVTTKGDLQTHDGVSPTREEVGTDGKFLVADSSKTNGIAWSDTLAGTFNPVTDWEAFTPTGSWTTNANVSYEGKKRRVGDTLEIVGSVILAGAPNAASLFLTIPDGLSIDTNKIETFGANDSNITLGTVGIWDAGSTTYTGAISYNSTTAVRVKYLNNYGGNNTQTGSVTQAAPQVFAAGDRVIFKYSVPILGWSSGVDAIVQNKKMTIVEAEGNSLEVITINTTNIPFIEKYDNTDSWDGNAFTAKETAYYTFTGSVIYSGSATGKILVAYVDEGGGFALKKSAGIRNGLAQDINNFNVTIRLEQGWKLAIRESGLASANLLNVPTWHNLMITQEPENYTLVGDFKGVALNSYAETNDTQIRIESCRVNKAGTPVTANDLCDNWITSLTNQASGRTVLNYSSSMFGGETPICNCTTVDSAVTSFCNVVVNSSTQIEIKTTRYDNATIDYNFNVICTGKI